MTVTWLSKHWELEDQLTRTPYNSHPDDRPDNNNRGYAEQIQANLRSNPVTVNDVFNWTDIVRAADTERRARLKELNTQAKNLQIQMNMEDNPRVRMILEVKYDLVHKQINRIIDEYESRPPTDLLRRPNISFTRLERLTNQ